MAVKQEQNAGQIVLSRRQFLGTLGATGVAVLTADSLIRSQNSKAQTPSLSPQPIACESPLPSVSPVPSEQPSLEPELQVFLSSEMMDMASKELGRVYESFSKYLHRSENGGLRVQFGQNRKSTTAALEYQSMVEIIALYLGDVDTVNKLFKFDDRYRQRNGLTPWLVKDNANNDVLDQTVVSNVMMYMAVARLLHPDGERQAEGREILESLVDEGLIDSGPSSEERYAVPQAFHWPDSDNLTNPAYWSPFHIEMFAGIDPRWLDVAEDTRNLMAKIDEQIENGKIVYFPNWVTIEGQLSKNGNERADITYDATYVPFQQAMGALFCEDPVARADARKQLAIANNFFYSRIAVKDSERNVTDYDISRLVDDYDLKTGKPTGRWPLTAFASAAALSSIVSDDEAYRRYMFDELIELPESPEPFNEMMRLGVLAVLSGKMGAPNLEPVATPEPIPSPIITPTPVESPRGELILKPGQVIEHGDRGKPEIFFTVDDGWDAREIIQILDIAKKAGIKLTFFTVGDVVNADPDVWKRAYLEGHSIQNHSMTHPENIHKMSEDQIRKQITDQLTAVRRAIGNPNYIQHSFRPPYGVGAPPWYSLNPRLEKVCRELGYAITTWTTLSPAWDGKHTAGQVVKELGRDITNGSILVLHDERADIEALPRLITTAKQANLKPKSLDALFT